MVIVSKFGGSSLSDSKQFKKVYDIIKENDLRRIIVCSAIGKTKGTKENKITDLLYLLQAHLDYKVDYHNIYNTIKERFYTIKNELKIDIDLDREFNILEENFLNESDSNYLISRGEYITSKMMAKYLNYTFIDAAQLIHFNYDGTLNESMTEECIKKVFLENQRIVVPGFYGVYPNSSIRLLSRGGSDVTGSILSKAVNAKLYENWTDVSGIMVVDPQIINNPKKIDEITYLELRELSYMGAKVLHEETIFPVQELNIPIKILNTNSPFDEGTIITNNCTKNDKLITAISGKKNYTSFNILKRNNCLKAMIINKVLNVFSKYNVNVEHIPTGIDSFSVIVQTKECDKCFFDILKDLHNIEEIMRIDVEKEIALIAIVGRNMALKAGTSGKIFGLIGNNDINIKMIAQGANEINIILGVSNNDFEKTIKVIYDNMVATI